MEGPAEGSDSTAADELAALDRAIAALEQQRAILGDDVTETALAPLRERRTALAMPRTEERRLVTVVFADLVDFTVLSQTLDSEDVREVVNQYFGLWQRTIEQHSGVVEKFIGDAVMAVFGLQHSYEDDAQRAVRAALAMTDSLTGLREEVGQRHGVELHMRVGIDTGDVVVSTLGERTGSDFVAVGPTVNRASRLQAAAPVDGVLVSAETHRQIRGRFSFVEQLSLRLKGIEQPVDAFVIGIERRAQFGMEPMGGVEGVETMTIGRDLQLRYLRERLADVAEEHRWCAVSVIGEAGVGKSRLLQEFDKALAESPERVWWYRGRAAPAARNRAQGLLRDVVAARVDIQFADTPETVLDKLERELHDVFGGTDLRRSTRLLGSWLGFEIGDVHDLPSDPQTRRDRGTTLLAAYFAARAREAPVVIMLEDLHWADDGSLRWLDAADEELRDAAVLVVATTRPTLLEERPHWGEGLRHHERLWLPTLSRRETRQLVEHLLQRVEQLPGPLVELVLDAADGNPFYVEELVTWLLDAGVVVRGEPHWLVVDELIDGLLVPATLRGVLQSRLDSLRPLERSLLQRASVVGRVFWDTALDRILSAPSAPGTGADLDASLDVLRRREVVYEREASVFSDAREFLFKHALLRDVAYDSVLRSRREQDHLRVAAWLAEASLAAGRADEYAAIVADHYSRARSPLAARYFLHAARSAAAVWALEETTDLLRQGLASVEPDDHALRYDLLAEREQVLDRLGDRDPGEQDLTEMTALSSHLDAGRRVQLLLVRARWAFNTSRYEEAVARAAEAAGLARAAGRADLAASAELWSGKAHTWSDDVVAARESLASALALAEQERVRGVVGEAYRYLSMVASNTGSYESALQYAEQATAAFRTEGDPEGESMAAAMVGTVQFHLGRIADSRITFESLLPFFQRSGHRYRVSTTLGNLSAISQVEGRLADALRWSEQAVEVAEELGDREAAATNLIVHAEAEIVLGRYAVAAEHLTRAAEIAMSIPSHRLHADCLARLAIAALGRDDVGSALTAARAADAAAELAASTAPKVVQIVLGHALAAAGDHTAAGEVFAAAVADLAGEPPHFAVEAAIALAGVRVAADEPAALALVLAAVEGGLRSSDLAQMGSPVRTLETAWRVLHGAEHPLADDVRAVARAFVTARAETAGPDLAPEVLADPGAVRLLDLGD